ncbi:MAG TPA: response regulator, partial [Verrucomicrobiae bacterium]
MKKVLIIEDDPIVAHIYRTRLEKEGYEVEIAADGQSGFYRIHEVRPDAVMLDLMLPKMNGVEILRKIRAQKEFQQTPIIVFTNAYVPNMIHESLQAGATQVYNKASLTPRQILDALHNAIEFAAKAGNSQTAGEAASAPGLSDSAQPSQGTDFMAIANETPFHSSGARNTSAHRASNSPPPSGPTPLPVAAVPPPPPVNNPREAAMQADVLQNFFQSATETIANLRKLLLEFSKQQDEEQRLNQLNELYRKVHALTGGAALAGLGIVSHVASALEVLLKELHEKPKNINPSTLRTVAH